tara:strand:- start:483 stop:677 length:195 start_codon:yes stop_codon:yes gene_type:complete
VSKVLEDNSGFVYSPMKGLSLFNLFEFLLEFTYEEPPCNEQCNNIDNEKNPFHSSPFFEHLITS